jgi:type II secretory pathway component PulF
VAWNARQKAILFRGMAILLNSGVHILDGLNSLSRQVEHPLLGESLRRMAARISQGLPLHKAMEMERGEFAAIETGLVKVGEASGSLHSVLVRLADMGERKDALRRKLGAAMVYPAFVLLLCTLLLIFAPVLVFSELLDLLRELNTDLPLPTRIYLGFSDLVTSPLSYLVVGVVGGALVAGMGKILRDRERRRAAESKLFSVPGLGAVLTASLAAEVSGAMATCLHAGVPTLKSLELAGAVTWSHALAGQLDQAGHDLRQGATLTQALTATGVFSPMSLTILTTGEEVGMTAEALSAVEKASRESTELAIEAMQKLVEPCLMLFVGLLVGFIAIATLAPTLKIVEGM